MADISAAVSLLSGCISGLFDGTDVEWEEPRAASDGGDSSACLCGAICLSEVWPEVANGGAIGGCNRAYLHGPGFLLH